MYNKIPLEQIEADVVYVFIHHDGDQERIAIMPHWECEILPEDIPEHMAQLALKFNEQWGCGYVEAVAHDFRSADDINHIKERNAKNLSVIFE